jgi:hypothetical protein
MLNAEYLECQIDNQALKDYSQSNAEKEESMQTSLRKIKIVSQTEIQELWNKIS